MREVRQRDLLLWKIAKRPEGDAAVAIADVPYEMGRAVVFFAASCRVVYRRDGASCTFSWLEGVSVKGNVE